MRQPTPAPDQLGVEEQAAYDAEQRAYQQRLVEYQKQLEVYHQQLAAYQSQQQQGYPSEPAEIQQTYADAGDNPPPSGEDEDGATRAVAWGDQQAQLLATMTEPQPQAIVGPTPIAAPARHFGTPSPQQPSPPQGGLRRSPTGEIKRAPTGEFRRPPTGELKRPPTAEIKRSPTAEIKRSPTGELKRPLTAEMARPTTGEHARVATGEHARPTTGEHARPTTGEHAAPAPAPSAKDLSATAEGNLTKTPLVHLLVYMLDQRLTGTTLFQTPEGVNHGVFFDKGVPSKVRTGSMVYPLDRVLLEMGQLDELTLRDSLMEVSKKNMLHGRYLVSKGLVDGATIMKALKMQMVRKIVHMFELSPETRYAFYADVNLLETYGGPELIPCDPLAIIMVGVRLRSDDPLVDQTLNRLQKRPLGLHLDAAVARFEFRKEEQSVVDLLRIRKMPLEEILNSGVGHERVARLTLYALAITRHLDIGVQGRPPIGVVPRERVKTSGVSEPGPVAIREQPHFTPPPESPRAPVAAAPDPRQSEKGLGIDFSRAMPTTPAPQPAEMSQPDAAPYEEQPSQQPHAQPQQQLQPQQLQQQQPQQQQYDPQVDQQQQQQQQQQLDQQQYENLVREQQLQQQQYEQEQQAQLQRQQYEQQQYEQQLQQQQYAQQQQQQQLQQQRLQQMQQQMQQQQAQQRPMAPAPWPSQPGYQNPSQQAATSPSMMAPQVPSALPPRQSTSQGPPASTPRSAPVVATVALRPGAAPLSEEHKHRKQEIEVHAGRIEVEDYFTMLGLERTATQTDIQGAYFKVAKAWHPDRLPPELVDMKPLVSKVFAKYNEAYGILNDPAKRTDYTKTLDTGGGTGGDSAADQEAVRRVVDAAFEFQKAEIFLKKNDLQQAAEFATSAANADPEQGEYVALSLWIQSIRRGDAPLVPDGKTSQFYKDIIEQLDAILKREPMLERALFYRGTLLKRSGFEEKAMRDFRLVSQINPKNIDAQREMRLFMMRRDKKAKDEAGLLGKLFKK